jgi:hypothetical protein
MLDINIKVGSPVWIAVSKDVGYKKGIEVGFAVGIEVGKDVGYEEGIEVCSMVAIKDIGYKEVDVQYEMKL